MMMMTITTDEFIFEKVIGESVCVVYNEFRDRVLEFASYANDFIEFDGDVTYILKNSDLLPKDEYTTFYDDSYIMERLVSE